MFIKKSFRYLACVMTGFLLCSCGFIPHDVTIEPNLPVEKQDIGHGKTLSVTLRDDRVDATLIGYRSVINSGPITLNKDQNLTEDIKRAIENGFESLNFVITSSGGDNLVQVDIRLINYETTWGLFTFGAFSRATFKVICTTATNQRFENTYRVEHERRIMVYPFKEVNRKWINKAVSDAIMRLFNDADLLAFLAKN